MATHSIAGTISGSLSDVIVVGGGDSATSSGGAYTIAAATDGLVYVIPSKAGYTFNPPYYVFNLAANTTGIDFTATATSTGIFNTYFHLRSKNASGTVQATFSPLVGIGRDVECATGEPLVNEVELADRSTDNYLIGFRQIVKASFTAPALKYIPGAGGYVTLEAVMNSLAAGYYLEYNVIDASAGGSNWVTCELVSYKRTKAISKRNFGVTVTIELASKSATVSSAFPVS
jgi:hypothetical protein